MKNIKAKLTVFNDDEAALVPKETLAGLQKFDENKFESISSTGFLPRVQLMISNSEKCKSGEFPINHYAYVNNNNYDDLGKTVDILVLCWRPKALDTSEDVISVYDTESEAFKKIVEVADSGAKDSGCMYGPEFLVWVPAKETFATLFCGSKTARNEAPSIKGFIGCAATLKSREINPKRSSYSWYGMTIVPCSTPFNMPDADEMQEIANKFNNPPAQEVEEAPEVPTGSDGETRET